MTGQTVSNRCPHSIPQLRVRKVKRRTLRNFFQYPLSVISTSCVFYPVPLCVHFLPSLLDPHRGCHRLCIRKEFLGNDKITGIKVEGMCRDHEDQGPSYGSPQPEPSGNDIIYRKSESLHQSHGRPQSDLITTVRDFPGDYRLQGRRRRTCRRYPTSTTVSHGVRNPSMKRWGGRGEVIERLKMSTEVQRPTENAR